MVLDMSTGEQVFTNCGFVVKEGLEEVGPGGETFRRSRARATGAE